MKVGRYGGDHDIGRRPQDIQRRDGDGRDDRGSTGRPHRRHLLGHDLVTRAVAAVEPGTLQRDKRDHERREKDEL